MTWCHQRRKSRFRSEWHTDPQHPHTAHYARMQSTPSVVVQQRVSALNCCLSYKTRTISCNPCLSLSSHRRNTSSVVNVSLLGKMMQLRKCVNHPYLIEFPLTPDGEYKVDEDLVRLSGKMMMLERMLTALLKEGHKVQGQERREG